MNKGCFVYIVSHLPKYTNDLIKSLNLLNKNYLAYFPADVHIWVRPVFTQELKNNIEKATNVNIKWHTHELITPSWIDKDKILKGWWSEEYLNMIAWMSNSWFSLPELKEYDYVCRLDSDSFIISECRQDLFKTARDNKWNYGYINAQINEYKDFVIGLKETTEAYLTTCKHKTYNNVSVVNGKVFYSNFDLYNMEWFRGREWQDFYSYMEKAGGIWYHRWTDCSLRYIGVRLFCEETKIGYVDFLPYDHQGIGKASL